MNNFLAQRKKGIGGSDIAAILGVSKFKTALDVYLSKTTDQPEQKGEHLYWGHALENPIIDRFIRDTGANVIRQPEMRRHPDYEWAIANADALITNSDTIEAILEIKTSSAFKSREWGADDTDEVPIEYIAQVQWYMWIYNLQEAYIAALIGGNQYRQYHITRDDELIAMLAEKAQAFWQNHVIPRIPPNPQDGADAQKLYPSDNGDTAEADSDTLTAYAELRELKAQEKELKAQIAAREDLLKIKIGNYSAMQANGNTLFTWKAQSSNRFDSKAFQAAHPDLYRQYTKQSETRVLRLK
ncbi:lambda-exonuclease family protein [uncultured Kingella sp.]|uniref:YqaJ viral recombinase family nuclease n=1 Tax=uncultured Kingella sp. TaxID=159270 RepID=UPI00259706F1|nr:YqaJ viral recombinase family protein [uncultured Kingella sp.]